MTFSAQTFTNCKLAFIEKKDQKKVLEQSEQKNIQ